MKNYLRHCITLLGFIMTVSLCGAQQPAVDPMVKGNQLYEKGDYAAAADQYRLVAKNSRLPLQKAYAWLNLGNCHVQNKAYNKAVVAYRRSVEQAPTFTRAWSVLGDVYYLLGSVGDATACFRRVLENEGEDFHARQMLGELSLKGGDVTEALRHLDAAVKMEPEEANLYLAEAEALTRIRDYEAAQKVMEQALLRLSKPPAEAYFYLGELYEIDGKPRKAVRAYEEGLSLSPKRKDYWFRIANMHERAGDDFLALLTLEQAMNKGNTEAEFPLRRGLIFFAQKRYDQALAAFTRAYDLGSAQGRRGIQNVAAVYANSGNKKKAEEAETVLK